jgi:hypothetical protein
MNEEILIAIATARAFTQAAGAQHTVLIVDRDGDEEPVMIEVDEWLDAEVTEGEDVTSVPHTTTITEPAKPLPEIDPPPPSSISIDLETGELAAPVGAFGHLADVVRALAIAFGGRSVASVEFGTSDPETPITIAARVGDPVVIAAGDEQFEL